MIAPSWQLDHVGIAVLDLKAAEDWYRATTNATFSHHERLEEQGVELVFVDTGAARIELLSSIKPGSSLEKFLAKRGPGLHHVCYRVSDIEMELARLSSMGIRLIDAQPRKGAGATRIAFLHPSSCLGTLTELCEYSKG